VSSYKPFVIGANPIVVATRCEVPNDFKLLNCGFKCSNHALVLHRSRDISVLSCEG
jgi:hypothetical protein